MQGVIGTYRSLTEAESAVRELESRGISIQNIVIADEGQRIWRKFHPKSEHRTAGVWPGAEYLVYMTDEPRHIERARALLRDAVGHPS